MVLLCLNREWTLRAQMLSSFTSVALLGVGLLLAFSTALPALTGGEAWNLSQGALRERIRNHVLTAAVTSARLVQRKIFSLAGAVEQLNEASIDMWNARGASTNATMEICSSLSSGSGCRKRPTYVDAAEATPGSWLLDTGSEYHGDIFWSDLPAQRLVERVGGDFRGSLLHSTWLEPRARTRASVSTQGLLDAKSSAHMDAIFPGLWDANAAVVALYVAFEATGVFRFFPGTNPIVSDVGTYDPRVRPWYTLAKGGTVSEGTGYTEGESVSWRKGSVQYTAPYEDAVVPGTWVITAAQSVSRNDTDSTLWVSALDVRIGDLQAIVLAVKFYERGFAFLTARDGTVVAHPAWNSSAWAGQGTPPLLWELTGSGIGRAIHESLQDPCATDLVEYEYAGEAHFLARSFILRGISEVSVGTACTSINTADILFMYFASVSVAEAEETLDTMKVQISNTTSTLVFHAVSMSLGTMLVATLVVFYITSRVTAPLAVLADAASKIANNAGEGTQRMGRDVDQTSLIADLDEIGTLMSEFRRLVLGLNKTGQAAQSSKVRTDRIQVHSPYGQDAPDSGLSDTALPMAPRKKSAVEALALLR